MMSRFCVVLSLAAVVFLWPYDAEANTVLKYHLVKSDQENLPISITWSNFSGYGKISGTIGYENGSVSFSGDNPITAYIEFTTENGEKAKFWRKRTEGQLIWEGKMQKGDTPVVARLIPEEVSDPVNYTLVGPRIRVTKRNYSVRVGDVTSEAIIYWHNYKGLGAIDGEFRADDVVLKFEGQNARSGYIKFEDADGRVFDLEKSRTRSGRTRWSGTVTALNGDSAEIELVDQ